jgi:hypothetical protein
MYLEWRRLQPAGMRRLQESHVPLFERTRLFKAYCPAVVPGFLQTPGYAAALLSAISTFHGTPDDVAVRMRRRRLTESGNHRFAAVLEEAVLRQQPGTGDVQAAQLRDLLDAMELPAVSLGIVPFAAAGRPMWPLEAFTSFDDERVIVELLTAQVTVTAPSEIVLYARAFDKLSALAVHGDAARELIWAAIDAL